MIEQMATILPELVLSGGIVFMLLLDGVLRGRKGQIIVFVAAAVYALAMAAMMLSQDVIRARTIFYDQIRPDQIAYLFRWILLLSGLTGSLIALGNSELKGFSSGEYQSLLMGSVVGGMFLSMSTSMVMLYLSIEFVSILSYILAAVRVKNARSYEASIKYILFGALSSGVLLFGLSMLYGMGGSINISDLNFYSQPWGSSTAIMIMGSLAMVIGGAAYKIAVVPFHFWCPDVYEGAPTPVTTFFSVAPKVAGFALVARFLFEFFHPSTMEMRSGVTLLLGVISAATMTLGNLAAIRQNNVKRMLAYSSIAHAGYTLMVFTVPGEHSSLVALFYLLAYFLMNTGAFLVLMAVGYSGGTENMEISAFQGLALRGQKGVIWSVAMTVFLFSLTGLPPFIGFIGKYYLFTVLIQDGNYWLIAFAILNTVVSLFYYARILHAIYFQKGKQDGGADLQYPFVYPLLNGILVSATLLLGIFPQWPGFP